MEASPEVGGSHIKTNLTEKSVAKLKAPTASGKQELIWDSELKGFGVLLSGKTNARSYIVQRDVKGRARRVTIGSVAEMSLKQARAEAADAIHALRQGKDPKAKDETLAEAVESYIKRKGAKLRPATVTNYRDSLRYLKRLEDLQLRELNPAMIEEQYALIIENFGVGAANNAMRTLRAVYNSANRDGRLPNLVRLQDYWIKLKPRTGHVKSDDLPRFYAAVAAQPNPVARDYVLMLLFTGLRRRTAAAIRWDDVDFSAGVIRLPAERMKSGESFDLPMTDLVRDLLIARGAHGREQFVFPSDAKSKHIEEPKSVFALVAQACGIKVTSHDLRRTYATIAERQVSGIALKGLLHHAAGNDVTSGYVMLSQMELAQAAQAVADRLRELCNIPLPGGANVRRLG
jgi:integrase